MKTITPSWENGFKKSGILITMNIKCEKCTSKQCQVGQNSEIQECSYGFNFIVQDKYALFGFLVPDKNKSKLKSKMIYEHPQCVIPKDIISNFISYQKKYEESELLEIEKRKEKIVNEYLNKEMFKKDFFENVKTDLQKNLSFLHDYQQINNTIIKNINVHILSKTKSEQVTDEVLDRCTHEEVAIYFASKMLEEKIISAKSLQDTSWLYKTGEERPFRVYGCVLKYIRMYKYKSDSKQLRIHVNGRNDKDIIKNPKAFSIIPHTLIDNAIKYSPINSDIYVFINDAENYIELSVESLGPLIKVDERNRIFHPFYRSIAAKELEEDGSGFGLFIAQKIADEHLNSEIIVSQESIEKIKGFYVTKFKLEIPYEN